SARASTSRRRPTRRGSCPLRMARRRSRRRSPPRASHSARHEACVESPMDILIRELWSSERPALYEHFLSLARHDRRLRFGTALSDSTVRDYVARIDFGHDALFGVLDEELRLLGVAHVARSPGFAELGVSVLEAFRH